MYYDNHKLFTFIYFIAVYHRHKTKPKEITNTPESLECHVYTRSHVMFCDNKYYYHYSILWYEKFTNQTKNATCTNVHMSSVSLIIHTNIIITVFCGICLQTKLSTIQLKHTTQSLLM